MKTTIAVVVALLVGGAAGVAAAAGFNKTTTSDASSAVGTEACVTRLPLEDGGVDYHVRAQAVFSATQSLPDGGSQTVNATARGAEVVSGATKAALDNFMSGPVVRIARQGEGMER